MIIILFGEIVFISENYNSLIRDYHNLIIRILRTLIEYRFKKRVPYSDLLEFIIYQLDDIILQNPLNIDALYFLAQCHIWNNDCHLACIIYERIISINPQYIDAYFMLIYTLERLNKSNSESVKILRKAIINNPDNSVLYNRVGSYLYSLLVLEQIGNLSIITNFHKKALELNPRNSSAHFHLGKINIKLGNLDLAKKNFESSIKFSDNLTETYFEIAMIYLEYRSVNIVFDNFEKDRYERIVIEYLEKARELDPTFTRGDYTLQVLKGELIN